MFGKGAQQNYWKKLYILELRLGSANKFKGFNDLTSIQKVREQKGR